MNLMKFSNPMIKSLCKVNNGTNNLFLIGKTSPISFKPTNNNFKRFNSDKKNINTTKSQNEVSISVDQLDRNKGVASVGKQPPTELENELTTLIKARGPLTTAQFIRNVLTHPKYGYYMNRDVFGKKGDFTTSPEISQMFGELVGIWALAVWQQMGKPSKINFVEIGPGRGTLMMDVLRTVKQFEGIKDAVSVNLVEVSPVLKDIQAKTLEVNNNKTKSGTSVNWFNNFNEIPKEASIIIAHELFDCLPIHQFEYTKKGWRERLVDIDEKSKEYHFQFVLAPQPSIASTLLLKEIPSAEIGDTIEISPDAQMLASDIANFVDKNGGASLIIDYGEERALSQSIKTIRNHSFKHVFDQVGKSDVSVSVDFAALKAAVAKNANVQSYGTVTQASFLKQMGIDARITSLMKQATEEQKKELESGYKRLIDEKEMGRSYKALAIVNKKIGAPFGFQSF